MAQAPSYLIPADTLRGVIADIFDAAGCQRDEAERIGRYLVSANLAGHDSHGVVRVPRYVQVLKLGQVRAGQTLRIVSETPTRALVDGNFGDRGKSAQIDRLPSRCVGIMRPGTETRGIVIDPGDHVARIEHLLGL